nr:MAG: RNA dependent RNA polymerase [Leviviridae sp.]
MKVHLPELFRKLSLKLFEGLDTPRALTCALLLRAEEYGQLVALRVDPRDYEDPEAYFRDQTATEWLRKCDGLPTGIKTARVAEAAFLECELSNARTNARLSPYLHNGPFEGPEEVRIGDFLLRVKQVISDALGPLPRELNPKFGPGSTFEDRGALCLLPDKLSSRPTVSLASRSLLDIWGKTLWCRELAREHPHRSDPKTVRGNRFTTVPKDATKDRGIAIEPSINVYYQLGLGQAIRRRLKLVGIDLDHGQAMHAQVARAASLPPLWSWLDGQATLDLSSASDSVSRVLVQLLLPEDWFSALRCLASPSTLFKGRWHYLEKFSSMGNGFTFELETLLFWGISTVTCGSKAITGRDLLVYGDDIIVPSRSAPSLISVLRFLGFSLNTRKSFVDSHFRESCGGDFFKGFAVRPHYVKELPSEPQHWMAIANGLFRIRKQFAALGSGVDLSKAWFTCLDAIPSHIRSLRGPEELGDLVIADEPRFWSPRWRSNGFRYFKVYRPILKKVGLQHWKPGIQLAYAVYGGASSGVSPRDDVSGYKIGWTAYS